MYLLENPVLQRELLVNLRMKRGFVLMLVYQALLSVIVYVAWPEGERLDLSTRSEDARQLVDMFFLGQYVLASLMAPVSPRGPLRARRNARRMRCCWPARCGRRRSCWARRSRRSLTWQC